MSSTIGEYGQPLRRLGFAEVRMHLMHSQFGGTAQGAAVLRICGNVDGARLREAAERLQRNYDILNADVQLKEDALWFVRRSRPSPTRVIEVAREDDGHWVRLLEQENSKALDYENGLWRLYFLRAPQDGPPTHELILLAHHGIIDGLATAEFFEKLLVAATSTKPLAEPSEPRPIAPAAEDLSAFPLSWKEFEARKAKSAQLDFDPMRHLEPAAISQRLTRVLPITPDADLCKRLLARAAEGSVSVNSFLSAIFLIAARAVLPEREQIMLSTAMSLRQMSGGRISEADLGCYLSVISTSHNMRRQGLTVLELAREHQSALLASAIQHSRNPTEIDLSAFEASLRSLANADRFLLDFGMTFIDLPLRTSYPNLEITAFYGAANRAIGSAAAILQGIQLQDRLYFTLCYTAPLQSDAWARALAESFLVSMKQAAASD